MHGMKSAGLGAANSMLLLHETDACMLQKILLACSHEQRHHHLRGVCVDRCSHERPWPVNAMCQG